MDVDADDETICRYCLDGADSGPLISPCSCKGGQKYVHLSCLRQWQRMVLVNQPTHPDLYGDDIRHQTCNVCKTTFTCAPPTRHELMQSFTGPEIAALIEPGCVISAHEVFSQELERSLAEMPALVRSMSGHGHWIHGVYLVTGVETDAGVHVLKVEHRGDLLALQNNLGDDLTISARGSTYRLVPPGPLAGASTTDLKERLLEVPVPCKLQFEQDPPPTCGDDHITAVGLQKQLPGPESREAVDNALRGLYSKYPQAAKVEVTHFNGGPCERERIVSCLVLGASSRGWKSVRRLEDAVQLAFSLAARRCPEQGDLGGGETVRVAGLQGRRDLNGEVGLALSFIADAGRWMVKLRNGEGVKVRPANLEGVRGAHGQVFAFWGDARWSRTQLLGEIARGHWGLCKASVSDLTANAEDRWKGFSGRAVFAPETAMTEEFMRAGSRQMTALRALARDGGLVEGEDSGDEAAA